MRLDGVEVVVVCGWLSEVFLEPGAPRLNIGYVRESFPYNAGKMVRNHEVSGVGTEDVPGKEKRNLSKKRKRHKKNTAVKHWSPLSSY